MALIWFAFLLSALAALYVGAERLRRPVDKARRKAAPGGFADLPSGRTHYQWHGPHDGQVCVCIHGLTTPSFVWEALVQPLVRMGFRVLTYDLYGRGFSDRVAGLQDRAFFLTQLEELLTHEELDRELMLIGYSMGGAIATAFASAHPERVDRLVLLASAGLGHISGGLASFVTRTPILGDWLMTVLGGWHMRMELLARTGETETAAAITGRQVEESRNRGFLPAVLSSQRNMLAEDQTEDHRALANTFVLVLAIWGDADRVIPPAASDRLGQANPRARQLVLAHAGHGLPYTHAREITAELQSFMRDV